MKLISLSNVSVRYDAHPILTNVNLDIFQDDFVGVVGPNGGGKTTLIKTILQLIPYKGEIRYENGVSIKEGSIGYMPQQNSFDRSFPISVREVILSGLLSGRKPFYRVGRTDRKRAEELMEITGTSRLSRRPIGELSGGEMQKTLLCRAIISEPRLLALDEPDNFVDAGFETELCNILAVLSARMAILMVSHDTANIKKLVKSLLYVNGTVTPVRDSETADVFHVGCP